MTDKLKNREIIFEFIPIGNVMKVVAVDTATMTEASIQCPINAGEAVFQKNALMRLEYVLKKNGSIT